MREETNSVETLDTPCLLLEEARLTRNIQRLRDKANTLGVELRPHLKTGKSVEITRRILDGAASKATVSTLREAEVFAAAGVRDILYAVGIAPQKLDRVLAIRQRGCDLSILLDSMEQAEAVAAKCAATGQSIPVFIEIDSDGHRSGLPASSAELLKIAGLLVKSGADLRGVLTHAGESYGVIGADAHAEYAERERNATVTAAAMLRQAGHDCPVVSVGSTPTAHAARDLTGVTELRAGVYTFFDLVMAGIGVCNVDDIALSVLTTVIGHQRQKGWILVDVGWMALSRDRGTAAQSVDQGYGIVCDADGQPMPELFLAAVNQEHGIIALRPDFTSPLPSLSVGTRLRILPNHACATAAQHEGYHLLSPDPMLNGQFWPRISGW
ncbi:DSD1 family PLP-dependent enzyme [Leisingera sp.]|uniref:DSD1 family PLP-dependent enzyme n=1 Tax=Leisingera sp. TaxID=1879318 RepID=UPI002B26AB72|nr:DSD1 family PLP-dependent enzyme [Leisingera sp.]